MSRYLPAGPRRLQVFRRLRALNPKNATSCTAEVDLFLAGRCLMSIRNAVTFKSSGGRNFSVKGNMGIALMPGSARVLDRSTGALVFCNATSCPNAQGTTTVPVRGGDALLRHAGSGSRRPCWWWQSGGRQRKGDGGLGTARSHASLQRRVQRLPVE